ncbi:hypothetical protein NT6N_27330 [Oceaniferula spumae]|uniref:Peptidyl-prolyl cis-trans isomerase n=1 Tax=Oceaniferula spumae TaxID=2979115 RepID=A0AAT9FP23_9BACT
MKNKNIASVLGVVGLTSLVGLGALSAQDAAPPKAPATPPAAPAEPAAPKLSDDEVAAISSYLLGYQHGQRLGGSGLTSADVNNDAVIKGFLAGLKGDKPVYEEDKIRAAMEALGKVVEEREAKKSEVNLAAGKAFLEKNGKRDGVTTTASGLQYEVINKGTDKKYEAPAGGPDMGTKFLVNYRGTLIDGTEFDKSPEGQPYPMTLQVIPGFKEALTTMPVGAKWKLFIPSDLAYGPRAAGPKIGANSTLIFELELVEIQAAPTPPPAPPAAPQAQPRPGATAVTPPVEVPAPPKKDPKKASAE